MQKGLLMKVFIAAVSLASMLSSAVATTIHGELIVNSAADENVTLSHYTYLKESQLDVTGYANKKGGVSGFKTRAFSYLRNGSFQFDDSLAYYDGHVDGPIPLGTEPVKFSWLSHRLNVSFAGEKGISEFSGKGFFPNNRVLGSSKKISYRDLITHGPYGLGPSYSAQAFDVDAHIDMGPSAFAGTEADYDFHWYADVKDAVIQVSEAAGWSNRTRGSQLIDWVQDAQLAGSLNMTNNLWASGLYMMAAASDDWLPCCTGTLPIYAGDQWPNINQHLILSCRCPPASTEAPYTGLNSVSLPNGYYFVPRGGMYAPPTQWYIPGYNYSGYYNP